MYFGQLFTRFYFIVDSFTLPLALDLCTLHSFQSALWPRATWPLHMFDMHLCKLIKLTKYCFLIMHRAEYWPHFHRDLTNAQIDEQFYNCIYAISLYFQSATNKKREADLQNTKIQKKKTNKNKNKNRIESNRIEANRT